jgi:putative ABC transport system permease protein
LLTITVADLVFRVKQFAIAVIGVSLVLAMALLLTGLADGFEAEVAGTVNGVGATTWVLAKSAQGRITAFSAFPELAAVAVQHESGVQQASPFLLVPAQVAHIDGKSVTVHLAGVELGGLGDPGVASGHQLAGAHQVVVDDVVKVPLGGTIVLGGQTFSVVGKTTDRTLTGGTGVVYMPLPSAQSVTLGGQELITAVVTRGTPEHVPSGLVSLPPSRVITDTVGQLSGAVSSIENTRWLMWAVAAFIVGSLLYVAALQRSRDFAVLKAVGSSSALLFGSLLLQSVIVTLFATVIAELIVNLLVPLFSQPVHLTFDAYASLPFVALIVGGIASVAALRQVMAADPAAAFT